MVAPSLLMLSVFCAWEAPADVNASAPSASAILLFMCSLLYVMASKHSDGIEGGDGTKWARARKCALIAQRRSISARFRRGGVEARAACAASTRLPAGAAAHARPRAR